MSHHSDTIHPLPVCLQGGLYLHVPFCHGRCRYCDFARTVHSAGDESDYLDTLLREIPLVIPEGYRVTTFFAGGGTPSTLSPAHWEMIFRAISERCDLSTVTESTCEANPESFSNEIADCWKACGVNRISFGVQTFNPDYLRMLGRRHTVDDALNALQRAVKAGFESLSIDLIYGLPEQTEAQWQDDLTRAVQLPIQHISAYGLTLEPDTPLNDICSRGELPVPNDDAVASMYRNTMRFLRENGFQQYEISNYYRTTPPAQGAPCEHNMAYWRRDPVLALGPSASGFDGKRRWTNHRGTAQWAQAVHAGRLPVAFTETLSGRKKVGEAFMLAMRLNDGVSVQGFREFTKEEAGEETRVEFDRLIERFLTMGFLQMDAGRLMLSERARPVADTVLCEFV